MVFVYGSYVLAATMSHVVLFFSVASSSHSSQNAKRQARLREEANRTKAIFIFPYAFRSHVLRLIPPKTNLRLEERRRRGDSSGSLWQSGRLCVSDATYVLVRALTRGDYFLGFEKVRTELFFCAFVCQYVRV